MIKKLCVFFALAIAPVLTTSVGASDTNTKDVVDQRPEYLITSILAYNHTEDYIHQFYVNNQMGPNIWAHSGGGATTCCLKIPKKWYKGLSAEIKWSTSQSQPSIQDVQTVWHKKRVFLNKYGPEGGDLQVHFLPNQAVVIVVSALFDQHPNYPGPRLKRSDD